MPNTKRITRLADLEGRAFASVGEVAAVLHYDARTVRKGIADGDIPAVKVGATFRVPVSWLREQAGVAA